MLNFSTWLRVLLVFLCFLTIYSAPVIAQDETEKGVIVEEGAGSDTPIDSTDNMKTKLIHTIRLIATFAFCYLVGFLVCFLPCISLLFSLLLRYGHKARRASHISWSWACFLAFIIADILSCWLLKIKLSLFDPFIIGTFCIAVVVLFILLFISLFVREKSAAAE